MVCPALEPILDRVPTLIPPDLAIFPQRSSVSASPCGASASRVRVVTTSATFHSGTLRGAAHKTSRLDLRVSATTAIVRSAPRNTFVLQ